MKSAECIIQTNLVPDGESSFVKPPIYQMPDSPNTQYKNIVQMLNEFICKTR